MKYVVGLLAGTLAMGCIPLKAQGPPATQGAKMKPTEVRVGHSIERKDTRVLDIFLDLLKDTGLRGGFVEIANCVDLPQGHLQIEQGLTVRQAMDALVAANPGYKWELRNGVVNLMPKETPPLLDTKIIKFKINATSMNIRAIVQDMLALPELKRREASLGIEDGPGQVGLAGGRIGAPPRQPIDIKVDINDLSLRDALNKIMLASPKGVWLYHESLCGGKKTFFVYLEQMD